MSTDEQQRRVLMLCYYFPPVQTVAIARNVGFARELPAQGWTPTVLTVDHAHASWSVLGRNAPVPEDVEIVRTPEVNLDRVLSLADGVASKTLRHILGRWRGFWCRDVCVPDPQVGWRVRRRGTELAREADCIYVSCSPFSSALAGVAIKKRTGRPLVLDFRDPWTLNPQAPPHTRIHRAVAGRMERYCISHADRVLLNTPGTLELYREQYPEFEGRFSCIPNGFDQLNEPTETEQTESEQEDAPFTIMHVGVLYASRDPEPLLQALVDLDIPNVRFVQVGPSHRSLERFQDQLDIHVTGTVPPERAAAWMRTASLLYLNQGRRPGNEASVAVTAKTYEYLATGLPVLADCPPGDNAEMVERFASYPYVVTEPDQGAMAAAVRDAWQRRSERVPAVRPEFTDEFSRSALAARLAAELDDVCDERASDEEQAAAGPAPGASQPEAPR